MSEKTVDSILKKPAINQRQHCKNFKVEILIIIAINYHLKTLCRTHIKLCRKQLTFNLSKTLRGLKLVSYPSRLIFTWSFWYLMLALVYERSLAAHALEKSVSNASTIYLLSALIMSWVFLKILGADNMYCDKFGDYRQSIHHPCRNRWLVNV